MISFLIVHQRYHIFEELLEMNLVTLHLSLNGLLRLIFETYPDDEYPSLTCPESYEVIIEEEGDTLPVPTQGKRAIATDNEGAVSLTYSLSQIAVVAGRTYDIGVQHTLSIKKLRGCLNIALL